MKRKYLLVLALSLSMGVAHAQGEMDVYKHSRNDLKGTARAISMGGAFGALGGDPTGIAINPAGIGVYTQSEISTTLSFDNTERKTDLLGFTNKNSKFRVDFDNFNLVGAFPLYGNDEVPFINFGFSYNRLKTFNGRYKASASGLSSSMADYMAVRQNNFGQSINGSDLWIEDDGDKPFDKYDWMTVFGWNAHLLDQTGSTFRSADVLSGRAVDNSLWVEEKGGIHSYDFNMGTTISNIVSLGMSVAVTDIDYRLESQYSEDFLAGTNGGFDFINWLKTEGTGWQVKAGVIVKPVNALRIGVSYHSPTWYHMTDYYAAQMNYNMTGLLPPNASYPEGTIDSGDSYTDYRMRTPDKWTFSLAGVIGKTAIISADYEIADYKKMKLYNDRGNSDYYDDHENAYIKDDFKLASTLRIGAEVRITPQFSARAGYAWMQSPLEKSFKNMEREVMTVGSTSHFTLEGDVNNITWGLGYRFTRNFYTDLAFVVSNRKDDLYSYSSTYHADTDTEVYSDKATLKTNRFQGLLTFGYKF